MWELRPEDVQEEKGTHGERPGKCLEEAVVGGLADESPLGLQLSAAHQTPERLSCLSQPPVVSS